MSVRTTSGRVSGFVLESTHVFLGIPFAAPPIGPRRFLAPAPAESWDGVRECFSYGPTAPQRDPGITVIPEPVEDGDDFLNLNVFTPEIGDAKLPVFVWIHGGGFVSGCNRSPWYRGTRFARDGVVFVSVGYRLGVEGFLDIEDSPPNRAMLDWLAALEWVHENIAAFGGDPTNVTIGGQSAGSAAALTVMVNPEARGLFRRVIAMSGTSDSRMPREALTDAAGKLGAHFGVRPTREAFSGFEPRALIDAWYEVIGDPFSAAAIMRGFDPRAPSLRPYADGDVVPEEPFRLIGACATPVLTGSTTQEINNGVLSRREQLEAIAPNALVALGIDGDARDAFARSIGSEDSVELLAQALTDRAFRRPLARLLEDRAEHGSPTWAYQFAWPAPKSTHRTALHCIDIPFAFDNLDAEGVTAGHRLGPGAPQELANEMHRAWVRFITDGDPGWPRYSGERRTVMVFNDTASAVDDFLRFERELSG